MKTYPFVQDVKGDPLCTICGKQVPCDLQGKHDVERHASKSIHADVKMS